MTIVYSDGLSDKELAVIEGKYGLKLPVDYRLFLSNYNGCRVTSPNYCYLPFKDVDDGFISFDSLFSVGSENENFCLEYINDECLSELESIGYSFLIGSDPGDNFYFLVTEGASSGVYYWDRAEIHSDSVDGKINVYKICEKFEVFFEMILSSYK